VTLLAAYALCAKMNDIKIQTFNRDFQKEARKLVLQGLGEHWGWINEHTNPMISSRHSKMAILLQHVKPISW
jgi:hypothetical protein